MVALVAGMFTAIVGILIVAGIGLFIVGVILWIVYKVIADSLSDLADSEVWNVDDERGY